MRSAGRRLAYLSAVLLGVSLVAFSLFALAPGDPAEIILRDRHDAPTPGQTAALRQELGLNDPLALQYLRWLGRACTGDLGRSWRTGEPVSVEIAARLPATLELALAAFLLAAPLAVVSGVLGALFQNRLPDRLGRAWTILCMSLPNFWLGLLLIYFFALKLGLLPVMGRSGPASLVLPAMTLGLAAAAMQGRVLRANLIEIMGADYIRFAHAKGLGTWSVLGRHLLRNALPPVVAMWGVSLGGLLGGSVIVESIFSWPGLGKLTVDAVLARDIPVVQGSVLLMALLFAAANQLADLTHRMLDPRVGRCRGRASETGLV